MEDMFGRPIYAGDKIVYSKQVKGYNSESLMRSPLVTGIVDKIGPKGTIAYVGKLRLRSVNIIKYNWPNEVE